MIHRPVASGLAAVLIGVAAACAPQVERRPPPAPVAAEAGVASEPAPSAAPASPAAEGRATAAAADPVPWSLPAGYDPAARVDRGTPPSFRTERPDRRITAPRPDAQAGYAAGRLDAIERQLSGPSYRPRGPRTAEEPRGGQRRDPRGSLLDIERRTLEWRLRSADDGGPRY